MGDTNIEWCDKVWNPTRGCSRVSQGCVNCYAETLAGRYSAYGAKPDSPFAGFVTKVNGHASWTGKVELVESMLDAPLRWKKPCRIFVNSMSDLFHEALPDEAIDRVFAVMVLCPQHTFQILTKRPERMLKWFSGDRFEGVMTAMRHMGIDVAALRWPLPNIWLGVSVEDQATADERIPLLLQTPAPIRFVSYEPALSVIDFRNFLCHTSDYATHKRELDWVIVGGESGPGARPFDIEWASEAIRQCQSAGVAVFVKQIGAKPFHSLDREYPRVPLGDRKGGDMGEWPIRIRVRQFPAEVRA